MLHLDKDRGRYKQFNPFIARSGMEEVAKFNWFAHPIMMYVWTY